MADPNSSQNPVPGSWQARNRALSNRDRQRARQATDPANTTAPTTPTTEKKKKKKERYKVRHASVFWYAICVFLGRILQVAIVVGLLLLIAWYWGHDPKPSEPNGLPGNYNVVSPSERFPYLDPEFEREEASKFIPIGGDGELGFKKGE